MTEFLPKETWHEIADALEFTAPYFAQYLASVNYEGKGTEDEEEYMSHMQMAVMAMRYVAEFAADKCGFIVEHEELP